MLISISPSLLSLFSTICRGCVFLLISLWTKSFPKSKLSSKDGNASFVSQNTLWSRQINDPESRSYASKRQFNVMADISYNQWTNESRASYGRLTPQGIKTQSTRSQPPFLIRRELFVTSNFIFKTSNFFSCNQRRRYQCLHQLPMIPIDSSIFI